MADFGLFAEGLRVPTIDEIRSSFEQSIRRRFGPNFPLGDVGFAGYLVGAMSERLLLLWESLEQIVSGINPDAATGALLKAAGLLTASLAPTAQPSHAEEILTGDDGTLVPSGTVLRTPDTFREFTTDDDVTLSLLDARAPLTAYDEGDRATNAGRCYQCIAPGTTDSGDGPETDAESIVDGTVEWTHLGLGTAAADVDVTSVEVGPVEAAARGITVMVNTLFGLSGCINLEAAFIGRLEMSDEDFRLFREAEVAKPATGPVPAITQAILALPSVQNDHGTVHVFENDTDVTDADGVLPHSVEVLVQGGDDQEIIDALLLNVPGGIRTVGNVSGFAVDPEGVEQPFSFSRPTLVPIFVDVTLTKLPDTYAGDDAVKKAVVDYGLTQGIGRNAVSSRISGAAVRVTGVLDVPRSGSLSGVLIGVAASPTTDATIVITPRQRATFSLAHVTVNSSDGEE